MASSTSPNSSQNILEFGRLGPVTPEQLKPVTVAETNRPDWLRELGLDDERHNIRCLPLRTRVAKRCLDICVASTLLVITLPVSLVAALVIKLTSPGPVFFVQTRVGLNARKREEEGDDAPTVPCRRSAKNFGKPFRIYKLRTMRDDRSSSGPIQAQAGDRRVTSVGRFLRKMRIDELPQLVNVLKGEMSMVGPRPECIEYIEELSEKVPGYLDRLGLKPGLTGIAQIEGGYANDIPSYRRKVAYDLHYLQNCCLWNDILVMLRTVKVVLTGFGAL